MKFKSLFELAKTAFGNWKDDYAPSMGAALAYYTVFSIAPLLVIVIAAAALIFGQDAAQAAIIEQASGMIGENAAKAIDGMLASAQKPKEGMIASALGIVVLIIGATTVFAELETNLNRVWKVEPEKGSGGLAFRAHAPARLWNGPGDRFPADCLAGRRRRDRGLGQVLEWLVRRVGVRAECRQLRGLGGSYHRPVRDDLQIHSTGGHPLA